MKKLKKKDRKRLIQLIQCEIYAQEQAVEVPYDMLDVVHLKQLLEKLS